jgi:hypothetical protein|tara:strand:- start:4334 stop:4591 length:258 start_codon:yes stop_codon:yes gene_type:complete
MKELYWKSPLSHNTNPGPHYDLYGDTSRLYGDCNYLYGDATGVSGKCSKLAGAITNVFGDLDWIELDGSAITSPISNWAVEVDPT